MISKPSILHLLLLAFLPSLSAAPLALKKWSTVPQCKEVSLHASYLAEEVPAQGPGFLLTIRNNTNQSIEVANPIPLSVHWYAFTSGRWLWRASSGSGGTLVDALHESGPLFAVQAPAGAMLSISPHEAYTWTAFNAQAPTLAYRPGCEHCGYSHEEQYQAVLAYALSPFKGSGQVSTLLPCGLRSQPVVMPPLPNSAVPRNSAGH